MNGLSPSAFRPRLSRTAAEKRPPEKSARGFLQWLRGRPCAVRGCDRSPVEAAHVPGDAGVATKASDRFAIPLCGGAEGHHATQHRIGWQSFRRAYGIDPALAADAYWRAWPGRVAWERKLEAMA